VAKFPKYFRNDDSPLVGFCPQCGDDVQEREWPHLQCIMCGLPLTPATTLDSPPQFPRISLRDGLRSRWTIEEDRDSLDAMVVDWDAVVTGIIHRRLT
jgi:hypothetical protein